MTLFICYLIIICFSLFECKLYVNRNIKAPCRALWMDSQLSENDAFCRGVCRSIVKTGVDFTIWREIARMQDAIYFDTAVYWVKFFFFFPLVSPPPGYMINEITSPFWSHGGQYNNHFLTGSNMLFLLVCVLSKCFHRRFSCISDFYFQSVFADIPNSIWNGWTHWGALGPCEREKWML